MSLPALTRIFLEKAAPLCMPTMRGCPYLTVVIGDPLCPFMVGSLCAISLLF